MYFVFKIILLIVVAHYECSIELIKENLANKAVSVALLNVIKEYFVHQAIQFDVYYKDNESVNFNEIYLNIQKLNNEGFTIELHSKMQEVQLGENTLIVIENPAIFFVSNFIGLLKIHEDYLAGNSQPKNLKFLVYIEQGLLDELKKFIYRLISLKTLTFAHSNIEAFEYILLKSKNTLYLTTIDWFSCLQKCNTPAIQVLNVYDISTGKWTQELINHKKFQDFHGCELIMLFQNTDNMWQWMIKNERTGKFKPMGVAVETFRAMSRKFNYDPKFSTPEMVVVPEVNFLVTRPERFEMYSKKIRHRTSSFFEVSDVFLVTPGELYTSYEKLVLPFDYWTWFFLLLSFLIAFTAINCINRLPKFFRTKIYGENVKNPALNVVSTFFGSTQKKIPIGGVARFLLVSFTGFCLIFRTCYQNKLFDFMTGSPRKLTPTTIEELKIRNYTVYYDNEVYHPRLVKEHFMNNVERW